MEVADRIITVVGLGISGKSATIFLNEKGAEVRATDNSDSPQLRIDAEELKEAGVMCEIGGHTAEFLKGTELMVVSPGVENNSLPIRWAEENNVPIISEIELGYRFSEGTIIAVSGTNGKSTVVSLLGEILKSAGRDVFVCGNIGVPYISIVDKTKKESIIVLEISSFQLERIVEFCPHISLMLNITEDHLDRYKSFSEYTDAKLKLFMNQKESDYAIVNYEQQRLRRLKGSIKPNVLYFCKYSLPKDCSGAYVENNELIIRNDNKYTWFAGKDSLSLSGEHNVENALVSGLVSYLVGIEAETIKDVLYNFKGLDHRFELVEMINGIRFVDDSKATNVDSTRRAIQSSPKGIILIAGGKDKGLDYSVLTNLLKEKVKVLLLIGEAKDKIASAFTDIVPISFLSNLEEAVKTAYARARNGDTVLLSPMCSSFDMFKDYKERGEVFRRAVRQLKTDA